MKKHGWLLIVLLFSILPVTGCATFNPPIPAMTIKSANNVALKSISIVDRTGAESKRKFSFFGDQQGPIKAKTPFSKIVGDDISAFFMRSSASDYSLAVQIQTAEPYFTMTAEQKVPFLGILASGMDVEYGVYLRLQFEVEQNGKVLRTYAYDNVIKTMGQNATPKDMEEGYQKLISEYRRDFFQQLDKEFVARYF